jgi:hypothetical protein
MLTKISITFHENLFRGSDADRRGDRVTLRRREANRRIFATAAKTFEYLSLF